MIRARELAKNAASVSNLRRSASEKFRPSVNRRSERRRRSTRILLPGCAASSQMQFDSDESPMILKTHSMEPVGHLFFGTAQWQAEETYEVRTAVEEQYLHD